MLSHKYHFLKLYTYLNPLAVLNDLMNINVSTELMKFYYFIHVLFSIAKIYLDLDKGGLDCFFRCLLVVFSVIFMKYLN